MRDIKEFVGELTCKAIGELYNHQFEGEIQVQPTKKEFEGSFTVVVFPLLRISKKSPEQTGEDIGNYLVQNDKNIESFNVLKGFLNLSFSQSFWQNMLNNLFEEKDFGMQKVTDNSPTVMIEYSSPNTNKPLHLGHIRNNLLGYSIAKIAEANGNKVIKTNIVNDRGIHICKSMYAWQQFANGETPESTGMKGDHLVGKYYVIFDQQYKKEVQELVNGGEDEEVAKEKAPSIVAAREMLRKWEEGDAEVIALWQKMNEWVYAGFDTTYKELGVSFDKIYYESDTYKIGRDLVLDGLQKGVFEKEDDGSVWADLQADGLDKKILLRSDGTSVYMTQDIGTAKMRYDDYTIDKMVYVVGNEQNYHFQVLAILLDKLGFSWGKDLLHFSYGMVELPDGKMKSREGTVVDADDLMHGMIEEAATMSKELGKLDGLKEDEAQKTYKIIALGALKYFMLKVDPKKNMLFNPQESIDFNGNTGPFIQYTYARIRSILRKGKEKGIMPNVINANISLNEKEVALLNHLYAFAEEVKQAGKTYSPALIANYCYDLAKLYNQFYHDHSVLNDEENIAHRLTLSLIVANTLHKGMGLLGVEMPERM